MSQTTVILDLCLGTLQEFFVRKELQNWTIVNILLSIRMQSSTEESRCY